MKGIVFNLLEQVVSDAHGEETWEALLDRTSLPGAYTAVGNYPDEEFLSLVTAAAETIGEAEDTIVRWFGRSAIPHFHQRYPAFFTPHSDTRSFLLTLNDVIHPEVRKLFPGAYAPSFEFESSEDGSLGLTYESHRGLCSFAEGLIEGAADHFGERVAIDQPLCTKHGGERCLLHVTFGGAA